LGYEIPVLALLHAEGFYRAFKFQSVGFLGCAPAGVSASLDLHYILQVGPYAVALESDVCIEDRPMDVFS
jgi:hypothetical protein